MKIKTEEEILQLAKEMGYNAAGFMDAADLVIVPEYRKYCEENLCHNYGVMPVCPPTCGTVDDMTARIHRYSRVLVLQTLCDSDFQNDPAGAKAAKHEHNMLTDDLVKLVWDEGDDILRMTAGPWKKNSCMSAYSVDVASMAKSVGMECWAADGKARFFSEILMNP